MLIGFKWLDKGESKDFSDLFDENLLLQEVRSVPIEHDVLSPTSNKFYAKAYCLLTMEGTTVTLDYEAFPEENKPKILLGITRFEYRGQTISNVCWKPEGEDTFHKCQVEVINRRSKTKPKSSLYKCFEETLADAQSLSPEELKERLPKKGYIPPQRTVSTTVFVRNPYVIVATLARANGQCERCKAKAPFISKSDGEPYLEVHHIKPLSEHGSDDIENTIALCPNCHRELHYGMKDEG